MGYESAAIKELIGSKSPVKQNQTINFSVQLNSGLDYILDIVGDTIPEVSIKEGSCHLLQENNVFLSFTIPVPISLHLRRLFSFYYGMSLKLGLRIQTLVFSEKKIQLKILNF